MTRLFFYFILSGCISCIWAQEQNSFQSIRYLLVPRNQSPLTSILFRLRGGSCFEEPQEEGFAHLLEHLVYRGGSLRFAPHQFRRCYAPNLLGGYTNRNAVDFSMLVESTQTLTALADLFDAVFHLQIQTSAILEEIPILLRESSEKKDFLEPYLKTIFSTSSSIAHSPFGNPQEWQNENPEVLRSRVQNFYESVFVPAYFQVVVVGEFDSSAVDSFFKQQMKSYPNPQKRRRLREKFPNEKRFAFSLGSQEQWIGIPHSDLFQLKLLEHALEFGYGGHPPFRKWMGNIDYEYLVLEQESVSYAFLRVSSREKASVIEKRFCSYWRALVESPKEKSEIFLDELRQSLEIKMEDVLEASEILYQWNRSLKWNELELMQRFSLESLTFLKEFSMDSFLWAGDIALHQENGDSSVEDFPLQKTALFEKKVWPQTAENRFFRQPLENKILFLYQGNAEFQQEGLTLLLGGEGEKKYFKSLELYFKSSQSSPFLKNVYVERDYLAFVWGGPAGYLDIALSELQAILRMASLVVPPPLLENFLQINSTIISYSGPVDWRILEEKLKNLTNPYSATSLRKSAKNNSDRTVSGERKQSFSPEDIISFRWIWKGVPSDDPDFIALKIICKWLGDKLFNQLIYQERLGYRMTFRLADQRNTEAILFSMKIAFRDYERIKSVWQELPETLDGEIVPLNLAKSDLSLNLILSLRTQADTSYSMARLDFLGLPFNLHQQVRTDLESIDFETLNRVYQTYIRKQLPAIFLEKK
ncbi:MAG: insulinase family protein [Planctomycetota bacterium]